MATINISVHEQRLTAGYIPVIASGGKELNSVHFMFDDDDIWQNAEVINCVFYMTNGEYVTVPFSIGNNPVIPEDVTAEPGNIFIGISAEFDSRRATSTLVRVQIVRGADYVQRNASEISGTKGYSLIDEFIQFTQAEPESDIDLHVNAMYFAASEKHYRIYTVNETVNTALYTAFGNTECEAYVFSYCQKDSENNVITALQTAFPVGVSGVTPVFRIIDASNSSTQWHKYGANVISGGGSGDIYASDINVTMTSTDGETSYDTDVETALNQASNAAGSAVMNEYMNRIEPQRKNFVTVKSGEVLKKTGENADGSYTKFYYSVSNGQKINIYCPGINGAFSKLGTIIFTDIFMENSQGIYFHDLDNGSDVFTFDIPSADSNNFGTVDVMEFYVKNTNASNKFDYSANIAVAAGNCEFELREEAASVVYRKNLLQTGEVPLRDSVARSVTDMLGNADILSKFSVDANGNLLYNGESFSQKLSTPEFVNDISECTDTTKLYVLPDGFIYAYMTREVTVFPPNEINWSNALLNQRVSGTNTVSANGYYLTNLIPVDMTADDPVKLKMTNDANFDSTQDKIIFYNSNEQILGVCYIYNSKIGAGSNYAELFTADGNYISADIGYGWTGTGDIAKLSYYNDIKYIRFNQKISTSAITNSDLPSYSAYLPYKQSVETVTGFLNTNISYQPTDYSEQFAQLADDVDNLERIIASLSAGSENNAPPAYWNSEISDTAEKIRQWQKLCGADLVCFAWTSDIHSGGSIGSGLNPGGVTDNIGKIVNAVMEKCDIPLWLNTGDTGSQSAYSDESSMINEYANIPSRLAPLWGTEKLILAQGNHDGCWGSDIDNSSADGFVYYRRQWTMKQIYDFFFRPQMQDFRRVSGADGTYFYIDNIPQKTRFIILNSNWGGTDELPDENDFAVNDRFHISCHGQAQFDWLTESLESLGNGWSAIIAQHCPLNDYSVDNDLLKGIIGAYCNKTGYTGSYSGVAGWSSANVNVDFTNAKGSILGVFHGHTHMDSVDTTTLPCPIIGITTAGGDVRDSNPPARTANTSTETAIDFVCINKATNEIHIFRCGAGNDRTV